jgi:hypothetical protein
MIKYFEPQTSNSFAAIVAEFLCKIVKVRATVYQVKGEIKLHDSQIIGNLKDSVADSYSLRFAFFAYDPRTQSLSKVWECGKQTAKYVPILVTNERFGLILTSETEKMFKTCDVRTLKLGNIAHTPVKTSTTNQFSLGAPQKGKHDTQMSRMPNMSQRQLFRDADDSCLSSAGSFFTPEKSERTQEKLTHAPQKAHRLDDITRNLQFDQTPTERLNVPKPMLEFSPEKSSHFVPTDLLRKQQNDVSEIDSEQLKFDAENMIDDQISLASSHREGAFHCDSRYEADDDLNSQSVYSTHSVNFEKQQQCGDDIDLFALRLKQRMLLFERQQQLEILETHEMLYAQVSGSLRACNDLLSMETSAQKKSALLMADHDYQLLRNVTDEIFKTCQTINEIERQLEEILAKSELFQSRHEEFDQEEFDQEEDNDDESHVPTDNSSEDEDDQNESEEES